MAVSNIPANQKNALTVRDHLQNMLPDVQEYAGHGVDTSSVIQSAKMAFALSDKLRDCFKTESGIASIRNALQSAVQTGLSLNPQMGEAALVPYTKDGATTVQYMPMKNGIVKLAMKSGAVDSISCDVVHENDFFEIEKTGDGDKYSFKPARKNRGAIDGYFAAVKLSRGPALAQYMTKEEAAEHRKSFSSRTQMPEEGYGLKTVIKKLLRNVSISPEMQAAVSSDEDDIPRGFEHAKPVKGTGAEDLAVELIGVVE
jgi:phage RecT family recombinase